MKYSACMTKRGRGEWAEFLQAAAKSTTDDCIEGGGKTRPTIKLNGAQMYASRAVWIIANGDPGSKSVLHTCDNALCVNINHLYVGTQSDNMFDRGLRNRDSFMGPKGEMAPKSKLTADEVIEIRRRWTAGETQTSLAREFNVSQPNIGCIVRRDTWTHI